MRVRTTPSWCCPGPHGPGQWWSVHLHVVRTATQPRLQMLSGERWQLEGVGAMLVFAHLRSPARLIVSSAGCRRSNRRDLIGSSFQTEVRKFTEWARMAYLTARTQGQEIKIMYMTKSGCQSIFNQVRRSGPLRVSGTQGDLMSTP